MFNYCVSASNSGIERKSVPTRLRCAVEKIPAAVHGRRTVPCQAKKKSLRAFS